MIPARLVISGILHLQRPLLQAEEIIALVLRCEIGYPDRFFSLLCI
ncbi:MAG: hypothetical protein R6U13_15030 [Desulfatiglandaceae bacterium]